MGVMDIARGLGVSRQMVYRHKKQGMPVDSLEAARAWRRRHLDHDRMKQPPPPAEPQPKHPTVVAAEALIDHARTIEGDGGDIAPLVPALRATLHAVPEEHRTDIGATAGIWNVLCAEVLGVIEGMRTEGIGPDEEAVCAEDEAWLIAFWYSVAAGEIRPNRAQRRAR